MIGSKKMLIPLTIPRNPSKQDPYDPWTAAIGGGLGLIGGLFQGYNNRKINEMNIAMQRETNALNERLFRENMSYQHNERIDQDTRNWKHAIDMFNMENAYNSPDQQVKRMIAAGLNPAALAGASAAGNSSMGSPSMGSAVGVGTPQLESPRAQMYDVGAQNIFGNMVMLSDAIGNIAGAAKSDADARETLTLLNAKLKNLNLTNDQLQIQKDLLMEFGKKTKQAEYDLLVGEYAKKQTEITLNEQLTETEKERRLNIIADTMLKDSQRFLNKKEYAAFEKKLDAYLAGVKADIRLKGSQSREAEAGAKRNLAEANYFNESALTQDSVRKLNESYTRLNDARKELTEVDTDWARRTKMDRIKQEFEKLQNLRLLNDEQRKRVEIAQYELEQAEYANDMKAFTYWSNFAFGIVDRGISLLNGTKGTPVMPWTHGDAYPDTYEEVRDNPVKYYDENGDVRIKHQTTKKVQKGKYKKR